jgi:hypothetical protein
MHTMHYFLFSKVHWLWASLHWLRHDAIHHWIAFLLVVTVGVIQTFLTVLGGKMSVPSTLIKSRQKRILRPFLQWGSILCLLFVLVGVLNDQNQYNADRKADLVVKQGADLGNKFSVFLEKFPNGTPPPATSANINGEDLKTYHQELNELRTLAHVLAARSSQVPTAIPPPTAANPPEALTQFSSLSNHELKDSVRQFQMRTRSGRNRLLDNEESFIKTTHNPPPKADATDFAMRIIAMQKDYDSQLNSFAQTQVPIANQYLTELLTRLKLPKETYPTFSADPITYQSVDHFVTQVRILDDLAQKLPD